VLWDVDHSVACNKSLTDVTIYSDIGKCPNVDKVVLIEFWSNDRALAKAQRVPDGRNRLLKIR
jgi:hypothetical protein